jgi:hypothetical protein
MTELRTLLENSLPASLPFYHLGEIREAGPGALSPDELEDLSAIGYSLQGDVRGVLVILVEKGLDDEVYSEAGNLIASRLATELGAAHGLDVMISPPRSLAPEQILRLAPRFLVSKTYLHRHEDHAVPVQVAILQEQGATHA